MSSLREAVVAAISLLALLSVRVQSQTVQVPEYEFVANDDSADEHRRFGFELGTRFRSLVRERYDKNTGLPDLLSFYRTPEGQSTYNVFLDTHRTAFPLYIAELEGMANATGLDFSTVFINNIGLEYGDFASKPRAGSGCSDYMICSAAHCVVGHNEDNAQNGVNHTILVHAKFNDRRFTGYTYAGDLPSGAFGFNQAGVAFTLNWVGPVQVVLGGIGRGFVSRSLLDATSFEDALSRATMKGQCAGHNYQVMDVKHRKIVNIETAPVDTFSVKSIGEAPFYHANQYETLKVVETFNNSSIHRLARVAQLPKPSTPSEILSILGDQQDVDGTGRYPIFHDQISHARGELSDWTVATPCLIWIRKL